MRFSVPLKMMAGISVLSHFALGYNFGTLDLIQGNLISKDNKTVSYQPNPLYETCTCDLTSTSCDGNCCCD